MRLDRGAPISLSASKEGFESSSVSLDSEELARKDYAISISLKPIAEAKEEIAEGDESGEEPAVADQWEDLADIDSLLTLNDSLEGDELALGHVEKIEELAGQFTGEAELVIDTGGFIEEVTDVSFSPDGALVAAAGGKVVRVWNVGTGDLVATLRGERSRTSYGNCYAVEFSPDGKRLLVGVNDYSSHGSIREYSTDNLTEIQRLVPGHTAPCRKICFSGTGERRISADADGNLRIAHSETDTLIGTIEAADPSKPIFDVIAYPDANENFIVTLDFEGPKVFSPDGRVLGPEDEIPDRIRGWLIDVFSGKVEYPFGSTKDPRVLDFALDRGIWAAAGVGRESGRNRFWAAIYAARDAENNGTPSSPRQVYAGHQWSITCIAIGPDSELAASGDRFGEVHIWNRNTGKRVRRLKGQGRPIYEVAFDQTSNRIAFGKTPYQPDVWKRNHYGPADRVLDLRQRAILPAIAAEDLHLNQERPRIETTAVDVTKATGDASFYVNLKQAGQVISRYRVSSGRNPTVFTLLDEAKLGVTQPVIFGDNEGLLALWDSSRDELRRAFIGHDSLVSGVSVSGNGKLMVSASTDRTIRIWSLEHHQPTGTFDFKFENTSVIDVKAGTSAARAGVQVGDEIVSLDGLSVTDVHNRMLEAYVRLPPWPDRSRENETQRARIHFRNDHGRWLRFC